MNFGIMSITLDQSLPSMDDVLVMYMALPSTTPARAARVKPAVAKTARILGKSPKEIKAHLRYLMCQLNRHRPLRGSPEKKSFANMKSELRHLIRTTLGTGRTSEFAPLDSEWAAEKAHIDHPPTLWKLSRGFAYLSAKGVSPHLVNDGHVEGFREDLIASQDCDKPDAHVRAFIKAWNSSVTSFQGSGRRTLTLPPAKKYRWTLKPSEFPTSFCDDLDGYFLRLSRNNRRREDGPRRALRPATLKHRRHQFNKAASGLVMSGFPLDRLTSIAVLVESENFEAALKHLFVRGGGVQTDALFGLANALRAAATHYVRAPQEQLDALTECANGLEPLESRLGVRAMERLEPFEDDKVMAALVHLPQQLITRAEDKRTKPRYAAVLAQVAIAIELEFAAALRLGNLAGVNLKTHVQAVKRRNQTEWILRFSQHETKNHVNLERVIPAKTVELIKRAMKLYPQTGDWLFPGLKGRAKCTKALGDQISSTIEKALGVEFNVHLFRALIATIYLKRNPDGFEVVRAMLGDKDIKVVRASYARFAERYLIAAAQHTFFDTRASFAAVGASER